MCIQNSLDWLYSEFQASLGEEKPMWWAWGEVNLNSVAVQDCPGNYQFHMSVDQWFSPLPMLQPGNIIPLIVVTMTIKLFLLLLHDCNFATIM